MSVLSMATERQGADTRHRFGSPEHAPCAYPPTFSLEEGAGSGDRSRYEGAAYRRRAGQGQGRPARLIQPRRRGVIPPICRLGNPAMRIIAQLLLAASLTATAALAAVIPPPPGNPGSTVDTI